MSKPTNTIRELLAELSTLIVRHALPEPKDVSLLRLTSGAVDVSIQLHSTSDLDAWASAMGFAPAEGYMNGPGSDLWVYATAGPWCGEHARINVMHKVPTGDEVVAVAS